MLGELFTRSTTYVATNSVTGASETFVVVDGLAPDWSHGSYEGAMSIPGVWRASTLLADLIGQLPWHGYRARGGGATEQLDPPPILVDTPCPGETRMSTFSSMAMDLLMHGNAIAIIAARDRGGWPTAILPVPAEYVQVRRATQADGYMGVPRGTVLYSVGTDVYPAADVVHIKGISRPGALRGMSVLEAHLNKTMRLADEQARQARQLGNLGIPAGLLKSTDPDFDEDDARELKTGWLRNTRDRTIQVLNATTEFEALAWDPTETQLLDARKFSLHEIALIFGLSPSWLGVAGASMTYSNLESEWLNLVRASLGGHLARFEQGLSAHLPRGTWAKANLDALVRGDTQARYTAHEIGIRAGFLTEDEARAYEDLPPLTAGRTDPAHDARNLAEMVQKLYLGIGRVLSVEDARTLLRMAGADLPPADAELIATAKAAVLKGTSNA